ncbi:MAG TPA: site-2 protease family protein [Syntrophorhabdaceae bacterium]|nr:site-2 protease family protein [Syntrophorhabdaceae bacterium]
MRNRLWLHILLFFLTICTTFFVGGPLYSLAIMTILLSHEMGHYFMTRRYGVPSTLPYFIPFPMSPFGTFGALIRMKGNMTDRKALFDIGVAGPLAGFVVSLPFIILGIKLSKVEVVVNGPGFEQLGDPLLFKILEGMIVGEIPRSFDLVLHPFAYAGWVGLFVTALNLLPVGQLDGGHVLYSVFGDRSRTVYRMVIVMLLALAVFYNPGWLFVSILLLIFGRHHPPPFDTETGLDTKRKVIAVIVLAIFVLSFMPAPFPEFSNVNIFSVFKKGAIFR